MRLLEGKNILITGGSRGIGKAIVERFVELGANVAFTYVSDRSAESSIALAEELSATGAKVKAYRSDASQFADAEQLIKDYTADFDTLDALVNNAGITKDTLLMRMTEEQFDQVIEVNLKSVFNLTKAATRTFLKQKSGSIINMSSVVGVRGNAGQANYSASKAGIIGFSKSVALELGARNVRCNVIAPGFIETEMTDALDEKTLADWVAGIPMKRGGKAIEVADLTAYLASDMSTYVTGQVIEINGGLNT
ncbi:3-oxoacyl-[acyl-carrier-protein] reductase [Sediminitomix flava]|uniref:3-oxoacyl-[acyl-carrier-protein] reductase n=1 Tax=Sediminitomix flava TaxID=379075 RepID=A0A315ZJ82_SEDFL|nr:3-oxoacyl-[acyl-carrier-protein] reductase [Sediminitomix flava]PWJ44898.1 3-oxoacyl-[acyl-carrier-protein] reductase [Sediminitomix flava]